MYDMYPWDAGADAPPAQRSGAMPGPPGAALATAAVQVALDRRDNGGETAEAVVFPGQEATAPTARK